MADPDSIVVFRCTPSQQERRALERFARRLRRQVTGGRAFHCLISTDRELRRLNRRFRKRDAPTDVLSFPAADFPCSAVMSVYAGAPTASQAE